MLSVLEAPTLCWWPVPPAEVRFVWEISLSWILSMASVFAGGPMAAACGAEDFRGSVFESMFPLVRACARRAPLTAAVVPEGALTGPTCGYACGPTANRQAAWSAAKGTKARPLPRP